MSTQVNIHQYMSKDLSYISPDKKKEGKYPKHLKTQFSTAPQNILLSLPQKKVQITSKWKNEVPEKFLFDNEN